MDNYEKLISRIAAASGLSDIQIIEKVDAKRERLSGLVSKEGAAQIVAAELGINLERERLKIAELMDGMRRAATLGKIINVSPVRSFNKNGREGKVCNLIVADEGASIKVVLWDTNHISLIEKGEIKDGDVIEILNGGVRNGEIHLGSFSDLKKSSIKLDNVAEKKNYGSGKLASAKAGESLRMRAFIVQVFEPRYFEVCPECGKKALESECSIHGKILPKKRALVNVVMDDGTGTMRAVLFGENINKIGLIDEEIFSIEKFDGKRLELLGEEKVFSGNVRFNQLYNNTEFYVDSVEEVSADALVKELEAGATG